MEVIHMSIRSERIKALVENSDMSYQDLEKLTGIKKSSLQRYASGVTTKIPLDVIEKLSVAFNVSQEYLMGWDEKKSPPSESTLTEGEELMLKLFRQIPEDRQSAALELLKAALKMQ
jgi:transcriptional regulator with XRE-family HTH domain